MKLFVYTYMSEIFNLISSQTSNHPAEVESNKPLLDLLGPKSFLAYVQD